MNETLQRYALAIAAHVALVAAWYLFVKLGNVPRFVSAVAGRDVDVPLQPNYNWWGNVLRWHRGFAGYFLAPSSSASRSRWCSPGRNRSNRSSCRCSFPQHDPQGRARAADHRVVQARHLSELADGVLDLRVPDPAGRPRAACGKSSPSCSTCWCGRLLVALAAVHENPASGCAAVHLRRDEGAATSLSPARSSASSSARTKGSAT